MTVAELIAELQKSPPDALVVMSIDPEGNGFAPLYQLDTGTRDEFDIGRLSRNERLAASDPVIVLWPR